MTRDVVIISYAIAGGMGWLGGSATNALWDWLAASHAARKATPKVRHPKPAKKPVGRHHPQSEVPFDHITTLLPRVPRGDQLPDISPSEGRRITREVPRVHP